MPCGGCGQRYMGQPQAAQLTLQTPTRGTTKGVILPSGVPKSSIKQGETAPPVLTTEQPVAGKTGPANNSEE